MTCWQRLEILYPCRNPDRFFILWIFATPNSNRRRNLPPGNLFHSIGQINEVSNLWMNSLYAGLNYSHINPIQWVRQRCRCQQKKNTWSGSDTCPNHFGCYSSLEPNTIFAAFGTNPAVGVFAGVAPKYRCTTVWKDSTGKDLNLWWMNGKKLLGLLNGKSVGENSLWQN